MGPSGGADGVHPRFRPGSQGAERPGHRRRTRAGRRTGRSRGETLCSCREGTVGRRSAPSGRARCRTGNLSRRARREVRSVVSSHSIPEGDVALYEPFLAGAWKLVASGGTLLIVTFKGSTESPIRKLSAELLGVTHGVDDRYTAMLRILREYGDVEITKTCSHVETDDFASFTDLWGSWFWRNDEQRAAIEPVLRAAADERFNVGGRYRVPEEHVVVATAKG